MPVLSVPLSANLRQDCVATAVAESNSSVATPGADQRGKHFRNYRLESGHLAVVTMIHQTFAPTSKAHQPDVVASI